MSSIPLQSNDLHLDELNLDETLLGRVREAHAHDHASEIDDPTLGMASASEMAGGRVAAAHGWDPATAPMSVLEAMQRDQEAAEARERDDAERVIAVVGRINKFGMRAATGQRVHHRREH